MSSYLLIASYPASSNNLLILKSLAGFGASFGFIFIVLLSADVFFNGSIQLPKPITLFCVIAVVVNAVGGIVVATVFGSYGVNFI